MSGGLSRPGQSVTSRVLGILDAFDAAHPRLSLSEISRRCGLPKATAHRLVHELVAWRGLRRGEDGRYEVGLRLWEVGLLGSLPTRLREIAEGIAAHYSAQRNDRRWPGGERVAR